MDEMTDSHQHIGEAINDIDLASEQEGYVPPPRRTVSEIVATDANDESLNRYKQTLLGQAKSEKVIVDANDPRNVILRSIELLVEGRPNVTMNLNEGHLDEATFTIKEGTPYRIRFNFHVQREICTGLKYIQKVMRHYFTVDRDKYMMGSYAPKSELQSYISPVDEAPSGVLHRGAYKVKSQVTDDDGHDWLSWTWTLVIANDWND